MGEQDNNAVNVPPPRLKWITPTKPTIPRELKMFHASHYDEKWPIESIPLLASQQDFHRSLSSFLPPKKTDEETDRMRRYTSVSRIYLAPCVVAEFKRFNKMPPQLVEGETINLSVHVGRVYVAFTANYKSPGHPLNLEPAELCVGNEQVVTPYKRIPICCNLRRYLGGSNVAFHEPM